MGITSPKSKIIWTKIVLLPKRTVSGSKKDGKETSCKITVKDHYDNRYDAVEANEIYNESEG